MYATIQKVPDCTQIEAITLNPQVNPVSRAALLPLIAKEEISCEFYSAHSGH
jgi:hypothetical protein